jgi:hypothetical protein
MYKGELSITGYKKLLKSFLKIGYKSIKYEKVNKVKKHLIIRHDVDFLPEDTLILSKIEKSLMLKSYYFFLVNTDFYNIQSDKCRNIINILQKNGHEIGLHFDCKLYKEEKIIEKKAANECKFLESITGKKVNIISFHRPNEIMLNRKKKIAGRMHTYMPNFFKNISYSSDSGGYWKYGNPLSQDCIRSKQALQLLTHAEWWQSKFNINRSKKIKNIIKKINTNTLNSLQLNLTSFSTSKKDFF